MLTFNPSYDGGTFEEGIAYKNGIEARNNGKSIFDYPYPVSDPRAEEWMNGFMFRDKELRDEN